jgi:hypothetical protein
MCRLQGVKMHIAGSQPLPPAPSAAGDDLAGAGMDRGAWTPCDVADLVCPFLPETQFDLPRVSAREFIHSCAIVFSNLFVVRKTWEFECSILSDTFETESELVRDAEAGATSLY